MPAAAAAAAADAAAAVVPLWTKKNTVNKCLVLCNNLKHNLS